MTVSNYCIGIVVVVLHTCTVSRVGAVCQQQNFESVPLETFDDTTPEDMLMWEKSLDKRAECAAECLNHDRCVFFQYSSDLSQCRTYPMGSDILPDLTWTAAAGYKIFKLEHRDLGRWGSACTGDSDCSLSNSECHSSRCRCQIGYSFNPTTSTCADSCVTYGQYYSVYPVHNILGHDHSSHTVSNIEECMDVCNQDPDCWSFDYNLSDRCILKHTSWLQIPPSDRGHNGWTNAQRQCKN